MKLTAKKLLSLLAVCTLAWLIAEAPYYVREAAKAQFNTWTFVVEGVPDRNRSGTFPAGPRAGTVDAITCAMDHEAVGLPARLSAAEEGILYCRIETSLRNGDLRPADMDAFIKQVGVPFANFEDIPYWTSPDEFLGSPVLVDYLVEWFFILLLVAGYAYAKGWRADWRDARTGLRKNPFILVLPMGIKIVVAATGKAAEALLSREYAHAYFSSVFHAPITEEILFRGFLFWLVARYSGVWFSALYISLIFAIGHGYGLLGTGSSLGVALVLQYVYIKWQSISLCIGGHMLSNAAIQTGLFMKES